MSFELETVDTLTETKTVRITPPAAKAILAEARYDRQRSVRDHIVKRYAHIMERDEWLVGLSSIILCTLDGVQYLVDGQHRLNAIIEADKPVVMEVTTRQCQTTEELAQVYYNIDRNVPRTDIDMFRATGLPETLNINSSVVRKSSAALLFMTNGFKSGAYEQTGREKEDLICQWADVIRNWHSCVGWGTRTHRLYTAPVFSVGLVTMRYCKDRAWDFWNRIARNSNLIDGTAEHTLAAYLLMNAEERNRGQNIHGEGRTVYARKVAMAWNAFHRGDKLTVLIVRNVTRPIFIAGTPYKEVKS